MEYEGVIGLEVHAELKTETKLFCGCSTKFGSPPNTQTCPVCLGLPGVLPVINEKALQFAVKVGLTVGSKISAFSKFDRKNYFYPDLPKNFQISQYDEPLCEGGALEFASDGELRKVGLIRVHLEEEAGKLIHFDDGESGVDFNRVGIPLLEIVSKPEIQTPDEAYDYLIGLKQLLQYLDVSDCNMEEGSLRCDANVSVRPKGSEKLWTQTEVKNMNSFSAVRRALAFEIERQIEVVESGGRVIRETRRWEPETQTTSPMRSKEEAHDYRYFPEPDLVPFVLEKDWIDKVRATIPELPIARKKRFMAEFGLSEYDAGVLTSQKDYADYFEECTRLYENYKADCNWVMGAVLRELNDRKITLDALPISPKMLTDMIRMIDEGKITSTIAKTVFAEMAQTGQSPEQVIKEKNLLPVTDTGEIEKMVEKVIAENPKPVEEFRGGKGKALGFLMGQVMRVAKGKADPQVVNRILIEKLKG
ncbi:MAG: Asp-tRNA(Asn)/Glu-tRNA(Gln) amidotransferase subunit GatB [bacterium]|nr:Asp-tRNA(Asn)/Glu-tRNA(Gln) amidotransferase subunit GatB [bacterium]